MNLEHLGADSATFRAFERYAAQGLMLARVALSSRDQYRLFTASGECAAEASGALWHGTPNPAGRAEDDHPVTRPHGTGGDQPVVGGHVGDPEGGRFDHRQSLRDRKERPGGYDDLLRHRP